MNEALLSCVALGGVFASPAQASPSQAAYENGMTKGVNTAQTLYAPGLPFTAFLTRRSIGQGESP